MRGVLAKLLRVGIGLPLFGVLLAVTWLVTGVNAIAGAIEGQPT